ncbi:hypothetical protein B7494_g2610 [Chlorociboria aeruginascens]|nr:hypothetical protein B7494_g2610 [Chlorociboria aeruginascens]
MSNETMCALLGNCTILSGPITNGTYYVAAFNPNAPKPFWHQRMELITICVTNSLTFIAIMARLWYRWHKMKRFRLDDRWMIAAGFFMIGYTLSQIATNIYGSGLHDYNVPEYDRQMHWHYSTGWAGYYIVTSCIKITLGIYGVWRTRNSMTNDGFYNETDFVMLNDIEIFMYSLGASFPVLSRYLVSRSRSSSQSAHASNFSAWARHVPDFIFRVTQLSNTRVERAGSQEGLKDVEGLEMRCEEMGEEVMRRGI